MSNNQLNLFVKRLVTDATLPTKATDSAAGFDLYALQAHIIPGGTFKLVGTGIAIEIPKGYFGYIRPRSGKATKQGLALRSSNVIDSDYRGEIFVGCYALGVNELLIGQGERFAQLLILPVPDVKLIEVDSLQDSERGAGGFGSTGVS